MLKNVLKASGDAKDIAQETLSKAIDSKAGAASVAASTAALGLSEIQSYAQPAATVAACILSVTLTIKHGMDAYRSYKRAQDDDAN